MNHAILYEDAAVVVADKPAGVGVIPSRQPGSDETCFRDAVSLQLGIRLFVVHRLDALTSGAVLFAKNADAHRFLCGCFEAGRIRKRYIAVVTGRPPARTRIDVPWHAARRGKARPAERGEAGARRCVTDIMTLCQSPEGALVAAFPLTGRLHQIRMHLRAIGCPIIGDPLYGVGAARSHPRLLLHHQAIRVPAPSGDSAVLVTSPLSPEIVAAIDSFGLDAATAQITGDPFACPATSPRIAG
ncbi:MAG: RNA pseudouridine synthase [Acidobacteriota bacterium]